MVIHPKEPCANLHAHAIPPPSSLQSSTIAALKDAASRCPSLTPQGVSQGVGVGYMVALEDKAACNVDRVRYQLKKARGPKLDSTTVIEQFEDICTEIDEADERGSSPLSGGASIVETSQEKYRRLGRPYIRSAGIEEEMKYLLVMSPLMSTALASSPFIETDITYNETKEYPYLFIATAFDPITMYWMVVCRVRITKQSKDAYALCFKVMFDRCKRDNPEFDVGKTLLGVIIDWSDAEAEGLRLAVGEEIANLLLKGCKVHWIRSYKRVADKVCKHQHSEIRRVEKEAFNLVAAAIQKVHRQQHVLQLFQCLCGNLDIAEVQSIVPGLSAVHIATVTENSKWEGALHWVNWWIRPAHLRMLSQAFTDMPEAVWASVPSSTNAVERKNLDSKQNHPVHFKAAMVRAYKLDKSFCLKYIAASENVRLAYTNATLQNIGKQAVKKAKQRLNKNLPADKLAVHGPPDRTSNFQGRKRSKDADSSHPPQTKKNKVSMDMSTDAPDYSLLMKTCKVLYDDDQWYEGIITGCERDKNNIWKYKISFSDGESTYASRDDSEVKFPPTH